MRRMDRYKEELAPREKRSEKNKDLYQNTNKYTNITDVTNANVYEINNDKKENRTSRESYHQLKKYQNVDDIPKVKKELDDFKYLYHRNEKKVYDINSVLEEARKNKKGTDELEEKRKLKHTSYNVLSGINLEELLKYREEKKSRKMTEEEQEIHDLVDTIASKTLAGELDKETTVDLLSDLMATNVLDKVEAMDSDIEETPKEEVELADEINIQSSTSEIKIEDIEEQEEKVEKEDKKENKLKNADTDFYTRSMDLSEEDFDMDNEFVDEKLPLPLKIFIILLIIAVIAVAAYFLYLKLYK